MKAFSNWLATEKFSLCAFLLCLAYSFFASALAIRQHDSFHTHAFDMAYFDNVIWNTSQGRLFVNDFPDKPRNFLGEHFSPALIALAPLYWLWADARMLLIVQAIALALTPLPGYWLARRRHPWLALAMLLAFYLNPALLGVALSEFHEIALAAPCISWALWAWLEKRSLRGLLLGLFAGLLAKEEVAVIMAAIGCYLIALEIFTMKASGRGTRFATKLSSSREVEMVPQTTHAPTVYLRGLMLIALALLWLGLVWGIMPRLMEDAVSHWQIRYGDVAPTPLAGAQRLLTDPAFLWARYAQPQKWWAVLRTLWPLAFLPLLSPGAFALTLPVYAYLLLSNKASVSQLQFWYVTPLLPLLFMATAMTIASAPVLRARVMTSVLLGLSVWAYGSLGAGPGSTAYEPTRFAINERTQCGHVLLARIPSMVSLAAQDNLMPHLAHRRALNVLPALGEPPAEYVAMDARYEVAGGYSNWPTVRQRDVPMVVQQFLARPEYTLIGDGCDYKILRHTQTPLITQPLQKNFGGAIALLGYEIAVADAQGIYQPTPLPLVSDRAPRAPRAVRVMLWWRAATKPTQDYTVFVHALDSAGQLVGQHDSQPANGYRALTTWDDGEVVRDLHYLTLTGDAAQISIGLYDARTGQRVRVGEEDAVMLGR